MTLLWTENVSDKFYLVIVKRMWNFYPRGFTSILLNKIDLIRFCVLYIFPIYMHIGVEGVTTYKEKRKEN